MAHAERFGTVTIKGILELDTQFRVLLKDKGPFHRDVVAIRSKLCEHIAAVFTADLEKAVKHDLEDVLWKNAHYKVIEEFRKRLKKLAFAYSLHDVQSSILPQLSPLGVIEPPEGVHRHSMVEIEETRKLAVQACHHCLIYLGDLGRYREIHSERKKKDWSLALKFYELSRNLIPTNGHPFNQIAVIYAYDNDELNAAVNYCRGLAVRQPFLTAQSNLEMLFKKILKKRAASRTVSSSLSDNLILLNGHLFGPEKNFASFFALKPLVLTDIQTMLQAEKVEFPLLLAVVVLSFSSHYIINQPDKAHSPAETQALGLIHDFVAEVCSIAFEVTATHLSSHVENMGETPSIVLDNTLPTINIVLSDPGASKHAFDLYTSSLPEDLELEGFLPVYPEDGNSGQTYLSQAGADLNLEKPPKDAETDLRIQRILNLAKLLTCPLRCEAGRNSTPHWFFVAESSAAKPATGADLTGNRPPHADHRVNHESTPSIETPSSYTDCVLATEQQLMDVDPGAEKQTESEEEGGAFLGPFISTMPSHFTTHSYTRPIPVADLNAYVTPASDDKLLDHAIAFSLRRPPPFLSINQEIRILPSSYADTGVASWRFAPFLPSIYI
ncbi:hypothetical protein HK405_003885 [Cladochytrium tenue]|nr:hypothetical protein HK405_003885 [Cladochytrium tenue]